MQLKYCSTAPSNHRKEFCYDARSYHDFFLHCVSYVANTGVMYYQINDQQSQSHVIPILTDVDIQQARKTTTPTNRYKKKIVFVFANQRQSYYNCSV